MKLTKHFHLLEFTVSKTAKRLGIENEPSEKEIENLLLLCRFVLEPIREHFKKPVRITSGYRNKALNKAVGGSKTSDHIKGMAADISIRGVSNFVIGKWIEENLEFKQLIYEFCDKKEPEAGWLHIAFKFGDNTRKINFINKRTKTNG